MAGQEAKKRTKQAKSSSKKAAKRKAPVVSCKHDWELEDRSQMRFRCQNPDCRAMGYRRLGAVRGVRLYRCRSKGCNRVAIKRGWHGMIEVFWCSEHLPDPGAED
jgi:hypothetical protein